MRDSYNGNCDELEVTLNSNRITHLLYPANRTASSAAALMASEHSNNAIVDLCYSEASYSHGRYSWETPGHGTQGRSKHQ